MYSDAEEPLVSPGNASGHDSDLQLTPTGQDTRAFRYSSSRTPLLGVSRTASLSRRLAVDNKILEMVDADSDFSRLMLSVESAIDANVQPTLISQGSSGSYFCRNEEATIVGVFKPKDEEPYGHLNPKWTKYLQKICCPCCFGRGCLVLNQGYLSEAGASTVDEFLSLNLVPVTKVVKLSSPAFHYSRMSRLTAEAVRKASDKFPDSIGRRMRQGLPPKIGSMQTFVHGCKDAAIVMKRIPWDKVSDEFQLSFQHQFERLVVLDYLIRNTDRNMDNWLIKTDEGADGIPTSIRIFAIDNGLAFPFKHPDNWRAYPYHWAYLAPAKKPFSEETANAMLPVLGDDDRVEELISTLYDIFQLDGGFDRSLFNKQMGVLRGQVVNLREALRKRCSPLQLVKMPNAAVMIQKHRTPGGGSKKSYRQIVAKRLPFFKNW